MSNENSLGRPVFTTFDGIDSHRTSYDVTPALSPTVIRFVWNTSGSVHLHPTTRAPGIMPLSRDEELAVPPADGDAVVAENWQLRGTRAAKII